jgi:hypothetical protein
MACGMGCADEPPKKFIDLRVYSATVPTIKIIAPVCPSLATSIRASGDGERKA